MRNVQRALPAPDDDVAIERFANDLPGFAVEIDARGVFSLSPTHSDSGYVVAIDPFENVVETRGEPPNGLELDLRAIVEA